MDLHIKQDRAVWYWLQGLFSDVPAVKILDSFPAENLEIPCISVDLHTISRKDFEIGNRKGLHDIMWNIDIFTENKAQRDAYAFRILSALDEKIDVYDYDAGFPPSVSPPKMGCLLPSNVKLEIIKIFPELTEMLYYRSNVNFIGEYSEI